MARTRSQSLLLGFARNSSTAIILIALAVLLGWILHLPRLTSLPVQWAAMNPFSALLFIAAGFALRRILRKDREPHDRPGKVLAAVVTLGGACKLTEFLFGLEFSLSQYLLNLLPNAPVPPRSEIAPNSAVSFILCGSGLLLIDTETRRGFRPAQLCFLLSAFIGLLALIGYVYRVLPLYSIGSAIPMSLISAVEFVLLSFGGLFARPDRGVMRVVASDTTAGATARRLLPAALLIPFALGAIRFTAERRGWLKSEFGVSLFVVANMILFGVLIWWNSRLLYGAEQQRRRAERRLEIQYAATLILAESNDLRQAGRRIIEAICAQMDWAVAMLWRVDERAQLIRCEEVTACTGQRDEFLDGSRKLSFSKGSGPPGQIWESRESVWIPDASNDSRYTRSLALAQAGLHTAIAVPISFNGTICGVMEFFSERCEPVDDSLLRTLAAVGSQIGQFAERRLADDQLKHASAELARSNTELQQFAYVASHDLSEPLRMIVSYLDLLVARHRAGLNAEAQEFIGYAVDGAQRMQKLIDDLLAYARVDNRGRELKPVDLDAVLAEAQRNLKLRITESGAEIEHGPLPKVMGDASQLAQVFQNILSNAIKFRGKEPPRIRIGAEAVGGEWKLSIQDNGIGIDPKHFERLFVIFQRLHTRHEYPGTGIGLAICKKIIERHGGRIWVESKPGQGTAFFFTLGAADRI